MTILIQRTFLVLSEYLALKFAASFLDMRRFVHLRIYKFLAFCISCSNTWYYFYHLLL